MNHEKARGERTEGVDRLTTCHLSSHLVAYEKVMEKRPKGHAHVTLYDVHICKGPRASLHGRMRLLSFLRCSTRLSTAGVDLAIPKTRMVLEGKDGVLTVCRVTHDVTL